MTSSLRSPPATLADHRNGVRLLADIGGTNARFARKGRFAGYLSQIPTDVITAAYPAFIGVSAVLAEKLSEQTRLGRSTTQALHTS